VAISVGEAVGLPDGVAVSAGVGVSVGGIVGVGVAGGFVGVAVGVEVGLGVDVGVGVPVNGPPLTVTAFVWARPNEPSSRTDVGPFGTNVGTTTLTFALPVLDVVTRATSTQDVPFFHLIRTTSRAAKPRSETFTVFPLAGALGVSVIRGTTVNDEVALQEPADHLSLCVPIGTAGMRNELTASPEEDVNTVVS
jgi:hypothetical protein